MLTVTSCKKGDTGATGATGAMGAQGAAAQLNPLDAPRTSIDRFSATAGHLQVRDSTNGLPAANAPINFDQGAPFLTWGFTPSGQPVEYYNFDVQSTTPAPIYVLQFAGGASVAGQINIVNVKPGDVGYNDFWQVNIVTVPSTYVANTITSLAQITAAGYSITPTTKIVNCPVVPAGSIASKRYSVNDPGALTMGWYKDSILYYFSFDEAALSGSHVPTSPIYVTFNINPGTTGGGPASGFVEATGTNQTHNVIATTPTSSGYSPLWSVTIYNNSAFSSVTNLSTAQAAPVIGPGPLVNCPVVEIQ